MCFSTRISLVVLSLLMAGCFGYVPGRQLYWDGKVDELCAKDGGTKIYFVVELPREEYSTLLNKLGELDPPVERDHYSPNPKSLIYYKETTTWIKDGDPSVRRQKRELIHRADQVLLAERVIYTRIGGEFNPPTIAHRGIPTYQCPSHESEVAFYAKVIKERHP